MQLPIFGWILWLAYTFNNPWGYILAAFPVIALFLGKADTWHRWVQTYVAYAIQAIILMTWYAFESILSSNNTFELVFRLGVGVLTSALSITIVLSMLDLVSYLGRSSFPIRDAILGNSGLEAWPSVCFQVPTYDEPPEMVIATIHQLLVQEYPGKWMIQVIDNNTPDPATWHPVRDFCAMHGERVEFMHP